MINSEFIKGFVTAVLVMGVMVFFTASPYNGPWIIATKPLNPADREVLVEAVTQWFTETGVVYTRPYQDGFDAGSVFKTMTPSTLSRYVAEIKTYGELSQFETVFQIEPHATQTHAFVKAIHHYTKRNKDGSYQYDGTAGTYEFTLAKGSHGIYAVIKADDKETPQNQSVPLYRRLFPAKILPRFYGIKPIDSRFRAKSKPGQVIVSEWP